MSSNYHPRPPARFRFGPLARAVVTMWRGWAIVLPVVLVNALVQAFISALPYSPDSVAWNISAALISGLVLLATVAYLAASALGAVSGSVSWRQITDQLFQHRLRLAGWMLIVGSAAAVGFALWTVPGILVLALTPYVVFAAIEGNTHPLRANFAAIRRHPWRWITVAVIVTVLTLLAVIVFGFTEFFLRGVLGASIIWLVLGLGIAWVSTAWALIYRRS